MEKERPIAKWIQYEEWNPCRDHRFSIVIEIAILLYPKKDSNGRSIPFEQSKLIRNRQHFGDLRILIGGLERSHSNFLRKGYGHES